MIPFPRNKSAKTCFTGQSQNRNQIYTTSLIFLSAVQFGIERASRRHPHHTTLHLFSLRRWSHQSILSKFNDRNLGRRSYHLSDLLAAHRNSGIIDPYEMASADQMLPQDPFDQIFLVFMDSKFDINLSRILLQREREWGIFSSPSPDSKLEIN